MSAEIQLECGVFYERHEDMSPDGRLRIFVQEDGDIIVSCLGVNSTTGNFEIGSVEFCSCGSGGGKSPKVRNALAALARAIVEDNGGVPSLDR